MAVSLWFFFVFNCFILRSIGKYADFLELSLSDTNQWISNENEYCSIDSLRHETYGHLCVAMDNSNIITLKSDIYSSNALQLDFENNDDWNTVERQSDSYASKVRKSRRRRKGGYKLPPKIVVRLEGKTHVRHSIPTIKHQITLKKTKKYAKKKAKKVKKLLKKMGKKIKKKIKKGKKGKKGKYNKKKAKYHKKKNKAKKQGKKQKKKLKARYKAKKKRAKLRKKKRKIARKAKKARQKVRKQKAKAKRKAKALKKKLKYKIKKAKKKKYRAKILKYKMKSIKLKQKAKISKLKQKAKNAKLKLKIKKKLIKVKTKCNKKKKKGPCYKKVRVPCNKKNCGGYDRYNNAYEEEENIYDSSYDIRKCRYMDDLSICAESNDGDMRYTVYV